MDFYRFLFLVNTVEILSVRPCGIPGLNEFLLFALHPDSALGLIYADDVHGVSQVAALRTEDHIVGLVEYLTCLPGVRIFLCMDSKAHRQR